MNDDDKALLHMIFELTFNKLIAFPAHVGCKRGKLFEFDL